MLYADSESIIKSVDELYKEKMNQMNTERKDIQERSTRMYRLDVVYTARLFMEMLLIYWKYAVLQTEEHIEDEVKRLYTIFPQQPMTYPINSHAFYKPELNL